MKRWKNVTSTMKSGAKFKLQIVSEKKVEKTN